MSTSNPEQPIQRVSKVYVAGSSAELERAERAIELLESNGIVVTSTWPIMVRDQGGIANPVEAPRDQRRQWSTRVLQQLRDADLVWSLVPYRAAPTRGAWFEAGYAVAFGKEIVFSGRETHQSIFCSVGIEFDADELALAFILRIVDSELRSTMQALDQLDRWRTTAHELARRLRNLRGIDDPDCARVLDDHLPIDARAREVSRG